MNITPEIAKAWAPLFFGILLIAVLICSVTWYLKRKNMLVPVTYSPTQRLTHALIAASFPLVFAVTSEEMVSWILVVAGAAAVWLKKEGLVFDRGRR